MQAQTKNPIVLAAPVQATLSQQRILERLHYVSSFSEQVVIMHGPAGAGKSTLAEVYLEQASDYAEVAFLSANGKQSEAHLRSQVLTQLYGTVPVSNKPLGEQLASRRSISHAIIVIDDAEHLPNSFVMELQQAMLQVLSTGADSRLSIVLSGLSSWAKQFKDMHTGTQTPLLMAIEPFSFAEQYDFVRAMLPAAVRTSWTQQRHKRELMTLTGYPGEIQSYLQRNLRPQAFDLGDGIDSIQDNTGKSSTARAPASLADDDDDDQGVAVALSAYNQRKRKLAQSPQSPLKLLLLPLLGSLLTIVLMQNQAVTAPLKQALAGVHALPDSYFTTAFADLPVPAETAAEATVSETDAIEPEAIPEDLAISFNDALTDLNTAAASENSPDELMQLKFIKPAADPATAATKPAATAPVTAPVAVETATAATNNRYDNAWALAQPETHYTIQVNRLSSTEWLDTFLSQSNLGDNARVYQYWTANSLQLVTVYGSYSNIDAARAAIQNLPEAVQQLQPWPKSFAAVHANIEQSL